MAGSRKLVVEILGDAKGLASSLSDSESRLGKFGSVVGGIAKTAAIGIGALAVGAVVAAKPLIDAASNLNESLSKSNTIFKGNAKEIEDWADGAAKNIGLSKTAALEAAGSFGNLFSQLDIDPKTTAAMSKEITGLAADFASFHNADISEVITAQSAAFRGEYDALQRYVPTINAAAVEQKALQMTGKKTTKELTAQDKALAVHRLMVEGAGEATGDFARTSGGLANQQRILGARVENLKAKLGTALIPVALKVTGLFMKFTDVAGKYLPKALDALMGGFQNADASIGSKVPKWEAFFLRVGAIARKVFDWLKVNVPIAAHAVGQALAAVGDFIGAEVIPRLKDLGDWAQQKLVPALGKVVQALREDLWPVIREQVLPALKDLAQFFVDKVLPVLGDVVLFIITEVVPKIIKIEAAIIEKVIPAIRGLVDWIRDDLIPIFKKVGEKIADMTTALADWAVKVWKYGGEVIDFFRELPGKIGEFFKDLAEIITAPFRKAFQEVKDLYDNTIGRIAGIPGALDFGGSKKSAESAEGFMPTFKHSGGIFRSPNGPGTEGWARLQDGERVSRAAHGDGAAQTAVYKVGERELARFLIRIIGEERGFSGAGAW